MPKRIQRKRTKGFKTPANTIYVGRPSKFGNPFLVSKSDDYSTIRCVLAFKECLTNNSMVYVHFDELEATTQYNRFKYMSENIKTLKGKNLSCFCKEGNPCHADVLLDLANKK